MVITNLADSMLNTAFSWNRCTLCIHHILPYELLPVYHIPVCVPAFGYFLKCNFNVNCLCPTLQNVMYSQRPFLLILYLNMIISRSNNVTWRLWSMLCYCFTTCKLFSSAFFLFFLFRLEILWLTLCQFHNSVEIEVSKKTLSVFWAVSEFIILYLILQ